MAPEVELADKDDSKSIKEAELLLMQQEEEIQKLKADSEKERADFERRYKIEWAAVLSCSPNNVIRREKLKVFNSEYGKRIGELKRQHEIQLKELEAKQLEARQKFREFQAPGELLNPVASTELGAGVEYLPTCDQAQPHNDPKILAPVSDHVAEGKSVDNIVEAMTCTGTGVGLSEDTNSPVAVPCSSQVEQQAPLAKHPYATEMDIMASEDGPESRNKCHNVAGNEYDGQGNIIPKHSNSREQCSDGATSAADDGKGCENFSSKCCDGFGQHTVTSVQLLANGEICDGEISDVPSGEAAFAERKSSISNDDEDEVPSSRQGKPDGTISNMPVCGFSEKVNANGFRDDMKDTASLNSQSPEECIASVTNTCMLNCEDAAQIHEGDCNGANNADTLNSPLSDERIASLNSKSPQGHVHSVNTICLPNCENSAEIYEVGDGNGSNSLNNAVTLNSSLIDERNTDGVIVSVIDREVNVGMPGTVSFTHCPDNGTGMNPPLSLEQISGGAVDVELSRPCVTASPSNGPNANVTTLLSQPSLERQHPDRVPSSISAGHIPIELPEISHQGATDSILDREAPVGMPGRVNCTDFPQDVTSSGASSPSNCPVTFSFLNPPSLQHQIPDSVSLSIPDGQNPVIVPETTHEVTESQLTDSAVVDKHNTSDQQEVVLRTMTENTLSQETAVSGPVDLMEPLEQVQPLSSDGSSPDQDTAREIQNTLVSSPVDNVPANQSNHAMEPPEQVQQLPSAEFHSSNQDLSNLLLATGIEHQPTNEDGLSSHVPEASTEVPNQALEQTASNLDLDSPMAGGIGTESSETRNLLVPSEINNHPIQTATQSASRIVPPLCDDPLRNELERIHKHTEQIMKNHEDMKLQLKSDFEKELEELRRKYEVKLKETEIEYQQTRKNLDTCCNTVLVNKILAEAFRYKCLDLKASGASGMQQDASFTQQLVQLSRQQNASWSSLVGSSSCGPPAASLPSSYTSTSFQNMVPSMQTPYNTSGIFSSVPARLPNINPISSPSGNLQCGAEMRAPAPHLQPYRPSTSVLPSSLCTVTPGMPSQPTPCNIPVTSPSFSHWLPQLTTTTYQSDTHRGHWPVSVGVLPTPNLPALALHVDPNGQSCVNQPNVQSRMSDLASLNRYRFGANGGMLANPAHQATSLDVVCLSDDD